MARKQYEMNKEQYDKLMDACKPTPLMYISGGAPMFNSPQTNANSAWASLSKELGFVSETVKPIPGKDDHFFTAEEVT